MFLSITSGNSSSDAQVNGRFLQSETSNDIGIDVVISYGQADPFGQYGEQHQEATIFNTVGSAACVTEVARCDQSLYLYQQRACSFHADDNDRAGSSGSSICQEDRGRIGDF